MSEVTPKRLEEVNEAHCGQNGDLCFKLTSLSAKSTTLLLRMRP